MSDVIDLTEIQPGLYQNITHNQYHRDLPRDIVSNSYLSRLNECPAKALIPVEDSPILTFGRAMHCFVLEGADIFWNEFAVSPKFDRRTKEGKAGSVKFEADNFGKSIINEEEYAMIKDMARAVLSHPTARELLVDGCAEQTAIWIDEETGIRCKCRPDLVPHGDHGTLVDLKGMAGVAPHEFTRSVVAHGYARQAGMYAEGVYQVTGKIIDIFAFIAVEKEPPYRVEVYTLAKCFLGWGYDEFHRLLRLEKQCREQGFYPHYSCPGATDLFLPKYLSNPD